MNTLYELGQSVEAYSGIKGTIVEICASTSAVTYLVKSGPCNHLFSESDIVPQFKEGDKVVTSGQLVDSHFSDSFRYKEGLLGVVKYVSHCGTLPIDVVFSDDVGGHNFFGLDGHCQSMSPKNLKLFYGTVPEPTPPKHKFKVWKKNKSFKKNTTYFKLVKYDGGVALVTVDQDGIAEWYVLQITKDGFLSKFNCIHPESMLQLDDTSIKEVSK